MDQQRYTPKRERRAARRGFTILEILVAIGVIMLLAGLLMIGIQATGNSSRVKTTHMMMENAKAMFAETISGGGGAQLNKIDLAGWETPGSVADANDDRTSAKTNKAMKISGAAFAVMMRMNTGGAAKNLPDKQVSNWIYTDASNVTTQYTALLDGWQNPILYVPTQTAGTYAGTAALEVTRNGRTEVIKSPDGRPFFASAGPDGDFQKGDDNVYSFSLE